MISGIDIEDMTDENSLHFTDDWGCSHKLSKTYAEEFLCKFFNEWPGGMEEIESCINYWQKQSREAHIYNEALAAYVERLLTSENNLNK